MHRTRARTLDLIRLTMRMASYFRIRYFNDTEYCIEEVTFGKERTKERKKSRDEMTCEMCE